VPLPQLSEEQRRNAAKNSDAAPGADPTVLPYTNFSVVMNRRRQLAYYTVVNIDGAQSTDLVRDTDRWFFDSRVAESEQIGEGLYRRNALDRGHLVRRLDPVWGPNAGRANDDTFHFTNCSPQHERFNQGQDLWQGLENYILDRADARDRKVTVFTGPVMDESDPVYKGVRLPLAFWKIIAYVNNQGALASAGYVLEQGKLIEDLPGLEAAFDPGVFRVTLSHLRERTGLNFDYLIDDELPLSADGFEAGRERVRIRDDFSNVSL
jgi:endonuclease G